MEKNPKRLYSLEQVAQFVGLTRQTLCNWSGCNSGYKLKKDANKKNAAAAMFIFYHLYGRNRIKILKETVEKLKKHCNNKKVQDLIEILEEEIKTIEEIYQSIKNNDKFILYKG